MKPTLLKNLNIRTRLMLLCLAVATPLLAMCGWVIWKEYKGLCQVACRATTFQDEVAVRTVGQWVESQENELKALSMLPAMKSGSNPLTHQILVTSAKAQTMRNGIGLFNLNGELIASSSNKPIKALQKDGGKSVRADKVFQEALQGSFAVSGYTACPLTGNPALLFAQPVFDHGKMTGILMESFSPKAMLQLFRDLSENDGFVVIVVDDKNKVIARTLENDRFEGHDFSHAKTVMAASQQKQGTIEVVGIADETPRTYAFARVPSTGWLVTVGIPTQAIYGSAQERLIVLTLCCIGALLFSVGLAFAFTSHFTGPILELVREALAIGRGDLTKRVNSEQGGELGLLARAFNQMALNLELNHDHKLMVEKISESVRQSLDLTQILNTTVTELGQALSASRCCLAIIDEDACVDFNERALEFNYLWFDPNKNGTSLKNRSVLITEGSILKIILEQGAILSLDVMDDSTFAPMFEAAEESPEDWKSIKSLIACPIILNKQAIGMILVHQCDHRRVWLEMELELVEAIARHVALALDHANLFARTRTLAEREFLINQIVRATRASLEPDQILSTAAEELGKALGVDYCQIAQPRPDSPLVVTHEFHALGLESRKGLSLYGNHIDFEPNMDTPQELPSVLGINLAALSKATSNGATLPEAPIAVIHDVTTDRRAQKFREFLEPIGTRSLIAAPLLRDDRVLGLLIVHSMKAREWQAGEVRLLAAVADQLAVAISHAQLFEQVKYQAITDGLTGLYNHIYFKNRLCEELKKAQRKGTPLSLVMIDLDKLKHINDTYGHPVGDAAIRQVAQVLKSLLRSGDTAARYGGEEFAVILPETPLSEAVLIADRLRKSINRHPVPGIGLISASMGAAAFPNQATALEDLIDKADRALYVAKRGGRNRVCVWDAASPDEFGEQIIKTVHIEDEPQVPESKL